MANDYLSELIVELPLPDEDGIALRPDGKYVGFIETFTIYYGLDESKEFRKFVNRSGFKSYKKKSECTNDFENLSYRTLKHVFVFQRVIDGLWGRDEANLNGTPYLLEASRDLEGALALFRFNYQKGCLQLLRSTLEASVIHGYLTAKGISYDDLERSDKCYPSVCDQKDGMLAYLIKSRFLNTVIADEIRVTYRVLSHAVHSRFRFISIQFSESCHDNTEECLNQVKNVSAMCTKLMLCTYRYLGREYFDKLSTV